MSGPWRRSATQLACVKVRLRCRAAGPDPEEQQWVDSGLSTGPVQVFCGTDYQIATPGMAAKARRAEIFTASRFSDHAPLTVDYAVR